MKQQNNSPYPNVTIRDTLRYIWVGIGKNKIFLFLTIACLAIATVQSILIPLQYRKFFDILSTTTTKNVTSDLIRIVYIVLALNIFGWFFWRVGSILNVRFQANAMSNLRRQAYNSLIRHSYTFFANNFTGSLVQKIGRYARAFERIVDRLTWDIVPLVIRLGGIIFVTYFINPKLTAIIIVWTLLYMIVGYFYSMWRLKYNVAMAAADSKTTAALADTITNQNNIEVFSRHEKEIQGFYDVTENQRKITSKNWSINMGLDAVQAVFSIIVEFIVFYIAIQYWQADIFTVGTFILLQLYIINLSSQLWGFARIIRDFYEGFADAKEMVEIMKLPYEIKNLPDAKVLKAKKGEVTFENVLFSFNKTREVLGPINTTINAGEKIALVGPSGAGKTTFVRLILRFYDVTNGHIRIDGHDIQHATLSSLRESISLVPQDPLLFHRTIKENIRYGRPDATDEEVYEAARLAHCDEFIDNLSLKYDTYVGERGIKLSGGERQRVAIARAILKNAPILILDEATSSLDSQSESLIQDALDILMQGKTTIVIAHRLSTIKKMDRIIVLKEGKILEDGSHDELTSREESLYKKMWELQAGGFIQ